MNQPIETPLQFAPTKRPSRPFLVWVTQVLLVFLLIPQTIGLVGSVFFISKIIASPLPGWQIALLFVVNASFVVLAITLFVGLVKARRWAWHGSVVFAILFMVLIFYTRAHPSTGPIPTIPIPANQLWGAAIGELLVTVLVILYPFRMFYSRRVRTFLGV
jgi:hypothetical protein